MSTLEVSPDADVEVTVESIDEVRRAIASLFRPGDVVEVRVPKAGKQRIISGYFENFEELARAVERLEDFRYPGVYWTANPVNPALLARADHKLKSFAEFATSDADIICRRWMLVDLDPKRPAGISSSDAEHTAALDLARQIRSELRAEGWPEPIFSDSGNGAHLLYPLELPNDAETADLLKRGLRALAAKFNTDMVAVDEGMYNASRIFKAYGTTARKGDSTDDRPHRVSRILEVPPSLTAVPIELLDQLAEQAPDKSAGRVLAMPFDKGNLNSMVKNSPARATGAHISIVGNITKEELLRAMLVDEMDNGFANRFLWACSRRSKCLPEGGRMWEVIESEPFRELQKDFNRIHYAVKGAIRRDADASDIWGYDDKPDAGIYGELTKERHGMYGACTARAAALTLRVSLIYALLDGAHEIRKEHLIAALEVWRYCDDSAKYIFGDALGDPTADEILRALRAAPAGLTRTEITALFDRHKSVPEISRALMVLHNRGLLRFELQKTRGRPVEKWYAVWHEAPTPEA
jgi:hypothetical protein